MKRVFFCGVLPSKYSGRWRDWPQFDFAKEKRNFYPVASLLCFGAPQTPLPLFLFSNGTGTEAGRRCWQCGQKFLPRRVAKRLLRGVPPQPPPFLPACLGFAPKTFRRTDGGTKKLGTPQVSQAHRRNWTAVCRKRNMPPKSTSSFSLKRIWKKKYPLLGERAIIGSNLPLPF